MLPTRHPCACRDDEYTRPVASELNTTCIYYSFLRRLPSYDRSTYINELLVRCVYRRLVIRKRKVTVIFQYFCKVVRQSIDAIRVNLYKGNYWGCLYRRLYGVQVTYPMTTFTYLYWKVKPTNNNKRENMNILIRSFAASILLVCCTNTFASLIGDIVSVDRRYQDAVLSSTTVTVGSDYEIFGWQSLYIDFRAYEIKIQASGNIGYAPTEFNGLDFYDLDFGAENEVISSITAYYASYYDENEILSYIDPAKLSFSDHSFSLNLGGLGLSSTPMFISLETRISEVPLPPSFLLLLSGISFLSLLKHGHTREKITGKKQ